MKINYIKIGPGIYHKLFNALGLPCVHQAFQDNNTSKCALEHTQRVSHELCKIYACSDHQHLWCDMSWMRCSFGHAAQPPRAQKCRVSGLPELGDEHQSARHLSTSASPRHLPLVLFLQAGFDAITTTILEHVTSVVKILIEILHVVKSF